MEKLKKILEEIDQEIEKERTMCEDIEDTPGWRLYEKTMQMAKHIIRKHLSHENNPEITRSSRDSICGECSRRKWYQIGYKDGKNDGWVPVEERLPEVDEDVEEIIEDDDCPEYNVTIRGASESTTLKYSPSGSWFDSNGYVYDVIAWRPLPEPYRTERR